MIELPQGWVEIAFSEVTEARSGNSKLIKGKLLKSPVNGAFPAFSASGQDVWHTSYEHEGDAVVVSAVGARCGKAFLASGKWNAIANTHVVKPTGAVDPRFLFLYLNDEDFWEKGGSAQPFVKVPATLVRSFQLPPLPEQRRIVAKIDSLTGKSRRARDHLHHVPRLVEKYKQAVLAAAFRGDLTRAWREQNKESRAWQETQIGEIAEIVTGSTPPTKERGYYGGDYPFVKPGDLDQEEPIRRTESSLTDAGMSVSRQLPPETVLVSCIGNLGKIGYLAVDGACNQQINAILPAPVLLSRFTYYWAKTLKLWLEENSSATTVAIINKGRFSKAPISYPNLEEQTEVVRRIEIAFGWIDRLVTEATSARRLIDRLDQAVLAKAFRGELVPQDPNDEPASVLLERIKAERGAAPKARRGRKAKTSGD